MNNFFRNRKNKTECKKMGICSKNPVLNSLEALIINEVRQIAFYVVKLKEFNLINRNIMEKALEALSVRISDTEFNRKSFFDFYNSVKSMTEEIRNFYTKKIKENNLPLEILAPVFVEDTEDNTVSSLIQKGEKIIKQFYRSIDENKIRLTNLIILSSKSASLALVELSRYKIPDFSYYFETLRLFFLTNFLGMREEKLKRRILEFSSIQYKIRTELNEEYIKAYGKPKERILVKKEIKKGKSILIAGSDIDELYTLLEKTKNEDINVYISFNMVKALLYPEFDKFDNLVGVFGTDDYEYDFSTFKGAIYLTSSFSKGLDTSFRGSTFTTKTVYSTSSRKIDKDDLSFLIEETKKLDGFDYDKKDFSVEIDMGFSEKDFAGEERNLIVLGFLDDEIEKKYKDYKITNFPIPNETNFFYKALDIVDKEKTEIYFLNSTQDTLGILVSILDKGFSKIYFENIQNGDINPHTIDSLKKDFNINII